MSAPIIFLDFDGVIRGDFGAGGWKTDGADFCPSRIRVLAKICETTGAKIVVSSDWRNMENRAEIEMHLGKLAVHLHHDWATPVCGHRWNEVARWLQCHPEVSRYAILEDFPQHFDGCPPSMRLRLILCLNRYGLQPEHLLMILETIAA